MTVASKLSLFLIQPSQQSEENSRPGPWSVQMFSSLSGNERPIDLVRLIGDALKISDMFDIKIWTITSVLSKPEHNSQ